MRTDLYIFHKNKVQTVIFEVLKVFVSSLAQKLELKMKIYDI